MAESNGLLNRRTGNRTGGSNPPLSAIFILNVLNHSVEQRTTLQASLASSSFFFTLGALIAEKIRKSA